MQKWELFEGYALGKQMRVRYTPKSPDRVSILLEFFHSEVCGPLFTPKFGIKCYFVTFIDEYSHYFVVHLLQNKSKVATKFASFFTLRDTQTIKRVRTLRAIMVASILPS